MLLKQIKEMAKDGFEKAKEEWERSVVAWGMYVHSYTNQLLFTL